MTQTPTHRQTETEQLPRWDVVVVGGGAAGLSGALVLARAGRRVLVVDDGSPRNAPAAGVHGYLALDGTPPAQLLAAGRAEVTGYGGSVVPGRVVAARPVGRGFVVDLADSTAVHARRLLVTTGLVDELPDVPGVAERWGRDVLHCPYCHGHEVRGRAVGVLATGPLAVHQAQLWRQWSADVTLLVHRTTGPSGDEWDQLAARGIAVVDGAVDGLVVEGDRLVGARLAGGHVVPLDALVVPTRMVARSGLLSGLGLTAVEQRMGEHVVGEVVPSEPTGATSVSGVYVAGNVADLAAQVVAAAAGGTRAAASINADLVAEDVRDAVAARLAPFSPAAEREVTDLVLGHRRHGW